MASPKVEKPENPSFRQNPESRYCQAFWTPAFAGVTIKLTFYETINITNENICQSFFSRMSLFYDYVSS